MEHIISSRKEGAKYTWHLPAVDDHAKAQLSAELNLSYPVIETLLARGFSDADSLKDYLYTDKTRISDPSLLKDAEKTVERIQHAIKHDEKILICGDYDVDGITSSAMMMYCLKPLEARVNFFLPHRSRDGYGLSPRIVERAYKNGYTLIITVDNGITAFDACDKAHEYGVDVIITDHHKPYEDVPCAYTIVNPQQKDCMYPFKSLAGVGVTFKVLDLLYTRMSRVLPEKVYELLMLGTIADVVPLTDENRYWVRHGLSSINKSASYAIHVLKDNARLEKPLLDSLDIGFSLAPQINALGRLEDAREGVAFLIGNNTNETRRIGSVLKSLNESRKKIERSIFEHVEHLITTKSIDMTERRAIIAHSESWQTGVIGLVASRLVSTYNRPSILFHKTKDGLLKGSCRSVDGCNIFELLSKQSHRLESFGGHAQAAGLALKYEHLDDFTEQLESDLKEVMPEVDVKPSLHIDAEMHLSDAHHKLLKDLKYLEPFGHCNRQPVFVIQNAVLKEPPTLLKDLHVKCTIYKDGVSRSVIFFNRPDIYTLLTTSDADTVSIAASVSENHFKGNVYIQLKGVDIAL
jgi:single-stranded-DNA-specific exonuclease